MRREGRGPHQGVNEPTDSNRSLRAAARPRRIVIAPTTAVGVMGGLDCRSSGACALQHYALAYGVDASRYRGARRKFEQQFRPGGVVFEPGKCILCGICVKLTELAREPLGLAFVGRGFDVRIAAPFSHDVNDGLQRVAAECVKHCPTGALAFADEPKDEAQPAAANQP